MPQTYVYLHLPTDELLERFHTPADFNDFCREFEITIKRLDCEKGCTTFIDDTEEETLYEALKLFDDEFKIGNYGAATVIQLLRSEMEQLETLPKEPNNDAVFRLWDLDKRNCTADILCGVKHLAEMALIKTSACLALKLIPINLTDRRGYISIFKDLPLSKTNEWPKFVHIPTTTGFAGLEIWFEDQQEKRNFNFNDDRHINQIVHKGQKKSPILGGVQGKKHLASLLKSAVTDNSAGEHAAKDLINWDEMNQCYVWFENEGAGNQYHAYHLVVDNKGKRDHRAEKRIPAKVIAILEYRQEQQNTPPRL